MDTKLHLAGLLAVLLLASCASRPSEPQADATRGRLLYENACIACHSTQAHWRDRHLVQDWPGLVHQVQRWQAAAGQGWSESDVRDVALYLNQRFYGLPCTEPRCTPPG